MIIALKISLITIALYKCFQEQMIFYKIGLFIENSFNKLFGSGLSEWLRKPLYMCVLCMSSFWTLALSPYFIYIKNQLIWADVPETIFIVCGINTFFYYFMKNFE